MAEFTNPNQQGAPQDNRPLILIMAVMLVVFFALNYFRAKNPQTASPNAPAQTSSQANGQVNSQANASSRPTPTPTVAATVAGQTIQVPVVVGQSESTTVVENELYRITFSNRGAQATSWILKKYKDSYGKPLDLVHGEAAEAVGYPLSLYTYDAGVTANLARVLYLPSATGTLPVPSQLTFKYTSGGYQVTKTFSFEDSYVIHADTEVLHDGVPVRALISWPGGFGDQETAAAYGSAQLDFSQSGKEKHNGPKDVSGGATLNGGYDWAGVSDLYFASIFLPDVPGSSSLATLHTDINVPKAARQNGLGGGKPVAPHPGSPNKDEIKVPILGAAVGDVSGHTLTRLFVGPKAVDVLRNVHSADGKETLEPLLDFGFFGFVGKYLFLALRLIHADLLAHVPYGWGWSIVALTVLINLIILPLRIKTMQSGLKMQRIQPQIEAIKAKYKSPKMNDPKFNEMQAEVMQYQKDQGVNMFGGCIPTLIQMPLLLAFFSMLPKVVELRQSHWFWLPDLSAADPWHILPVVMMLSQFLVQFYTPSPGVDPQQQKMMAFMMPVVSGYMTWNYASGLALYWSVGNLISIATQQVMNKTSLGREMREIAMKRARRKAGVGTGGKASPKTITAKPVRR